MMDHIRETGGMDAYWDGITSRLNEFVPPCHYTPLRTLMEMQSQDHEEGDTEDDH
jgi:hypothetical protein